MNDETFTRKIREIDDAFGADLKKASDEYNAMIDAAKELHRNRTQNITAEYRAANA